MNKLEVGEAGLPHCDYIINCIGVIKPFMKDSQKNAIKLNCLFPMILSEYCEKNGCKLIHITTDCVFSGKDGGYTEDSIHDALDDYGKSKSLGESCQDKSMVIRTSIIGEEVHKQASLIAWVQSQKGKEVNGYTNHLWNGVTTKQYAKICSDIIDNDLYEEGLFHVFSNPINKLDLVNCISDRFELGITVNPFEAPESCDRTMNTIKDLCGKLNIPSIEQQIKEI
jgi:dTDP-4-dehydrorhamnose reductase